MGSKKDYFIQRNASLIGQNRIRAAHREVKTIKFILKEFFNFELVEGMNVLDLGSGDRFLKNEFESKGIIYKDYDINNIDFEKINLKTQIISLI